MRAGRRPRPPPAADAASQKGLAPLGFPALDGFGTLSLARTLDSLVRVSRRADEVVSASGPEGAGGRSPRGTAPPPGNLGRATRKPGGTRPSGDVRGAQPTLTSRGASRAAKSGPSAPEGSTSPRRFPLNEFRHFLTLFSKFFSSFPHGTCSLSVSRRYLAFDGIYHRLRAAFPSNPTPRNGLEKRGSRPPTGLSPSATPLSSGLGDRTARSAALQTTTRTPKGQIDTLGSSRFARRY